jgi:acetyl esterase/lipase
MSLKNLPFVLLLALGCASGCAPEVGQPATTARPVDASADQPVPTADASAADAGTADAGTAPSCAPLMTITPSAATAMRCAAGTYSTLSAIRYATSSPAQLLDLYRPSSGAGPFPTIVWIHGGGWQSGSRASVAQILGLVCQGYAIASIDYRLSGEAVFPAQIHDVKAAIRFLRANATTHNLDANRFVAAGSSAGGHLAALAGVSRGVAALEDLSLGNATVSSAVQAVIDWYGPSDLAQMDAQLLAQGCGAGRAHHNDADSGESRLLGCALPDCDRARLAAVNPITYVDRDDPPFMILHGDLDCTVPTAQSRLLGDALVAARRCPWQGTVVGAAHGGPAWTSPEVQATSVSFLRAALPR